jgi:hypothetical protein
VLVSLEFSAELLFDKARQVNERNLAARETDLDRDDYPPDLELRIASWTRAHANG